MNREELIISIIQELKNEEMNEVVLVSVAGALLNRLYKREQPNRLKTADAVRRIIYRDWET
jgi:hypothetical protein